MLVDRDSRLISHIARFGLFRRRGGGGSGLDTCLSSLFFALLDDSLPFRGLLLLFEVVVMIVHYQRQGKDVPEVVHDKVHDP